MLIWTNSCEYRHADYLFLDRDGVLNIDSPDYIKHWNEFAFYPDSLEALRQCKDKGIGAILISNQSAINRGLISLEDFWSLHHHMVQRIEAEGGSLSAAFYCPHRPDELCSCRKPATGMLIEAAKLFDISLPDAYMLGDRATDLQAAFSAGCQPVLVARESSISRTFDTDLGGSAPVRSYPDLVSAVAALY